MCYSKYVQKRRFLIWLLQEFCGSCCFSSQKEYFENIFFEETFQKTRTGTYPFTVECEACVRKCICGNCVKRWSVRRVDCIAVPNICFSGRTHFCFTKLAETKFRFRFSLYHRRKGQYRSVGRWKTISSRRLLQVVYKTESMIKVAFIDSFKNRKPVRAVSSRYAEHFCSKTWLHDGGK